MQTRIDLHHLSASVFAGMTMVMDHLSDHVSSKHGGGDCSSVMCVRWCADAGSAFAETSLMDGLDVCGLDKIIFQSIESLRSSFRSLTGTRQQSVLTLLFQDTGP